MFAGKCSASQQETSKFPAETSNLTSQSPSQRSGEHCAARADHVRLRADRSVAHGGRQSVPRGVCPAAVAHGGLFDLRGATTGANDWLYGAVLYHVVHVRYGGDKVCVRTAGDCRSDGLNSVGFNLTEMGINTN